uniref:Uncharacterized protein n=1 Tax=Chenopodium quinoa TaxID=63459 RepID=A0A803MS81_CHEQI
MSNSSIEEELPSLSTVRRRLIRQSLGKDLGRSGGTDSSLSDNIDDPFQPLSLEEQKKAFYRHKLLADCEKATRPVNLCIPEDIEILDIEPVNVRYHLRIFDNTRFDQYGSNVGNIGVSITSMPRMKQTSYQPEVAAREAAESSKKPGQGQVVSPRSSDSDKEEHPPTRLEDQSSPVHESAVNSVLGDEDDNNSDDESRDDVVDLTAELMTLKRDGQYEGLWSLYTASRKYIVHPKLSSCKGWQDKFFFLSVPDDYPIRRTFYRPHPRFDTIPERELGRHELRAVNYFDIVESKDDEGRSRLAPKVWVPNAGYILGNAPLSHVGLCCTDCYGVDKLDNKQLGLSADGKRVIRRCPRAPSSSYDMLASYCSRASPVNPKRKAKKMADDQSKKRKLSTLRNRRGGNVGVVNTRLSDIQSEKKSRENDNQTKRSSPSSKPATIEDKTVVQSSEPITKKMTDGVEIEDLTRTSESPPLQPNETIPPVGQNIPITAGGSDTSIPGLIYRSHQWIECLEGRFRKLF